MTYSLKTKWFDARLLRQDMAFYDLQDVSGTAMSISEAGGKYKNGVGQKLGEGYNYFSHSSADSSMHSMLLGERVLFFLWLSHS